MEIIKHYPQVWFTSDLHLDHEFMIHGIPGQRVPRPMFTTVEEMNECIISRHNERVRKGDLIYDLGDFAVRSTEEKAAAHLKRMNGQRYQLEGNHDQIAEKLSKKGAFVWFRKLEELSLGPPHFETKQAIVICHYALRVWHGSHKGAYHLYGHSHSMLPEDHTLSFDVGVDCWNFYPVSIEQVKEKMALKIPAWQAYKDALKASDAGRVE